MSGNFHLPPVGYGPGSQPVEDETLEYMSLPQDMRAYSMHVPDAPTDVDTAMVLALLGTLADTAERVADLGGTERRDISGLGKAERRLLAETLGSGEVAMRLFGVPAIAVQESVFAGVWWLSGADIDVIEIGSVPQNAISRAAAPRHAAGGPQLVRGPGVVNAPPLVVELFDRSAAWAPGMDPHVVNLTLLPHTEEDLAWLDAALGKGSVEILSRGYGNCRIEATALPRVWRVRFYNSMDTLILDTFEVTDMPVVALAAPEDLRDSAERLREVREAMQ